MWILVEWVFHDQLPNLSKHVFAVADYGLNHEEQLIFKRDEASQISRVMAAEVAFRRLKAGHKQGRRLRFNRYLLPTGFAKSFWRPCPEKSLPIFYNPI